MTPFKVDISLEDLALEKMRPVLGAGRARALLDELLDELHLELATPQDLYTLSQALAQRAGYEGAVGAMLGVTAVMRGARPVAKRASTQPRG